jgi:hypothetical protein
MPEDQKTSARSGEELVVITRAYDLVREMTLRVDKFPRSRKYVLGDRILANVYEVLELLIEARYRREKVPLLDRVNVTLEKLRFQVRLAHDERYLSTRQYEFLVRQIDEVGRLVGGWRKTQRAS